MEKLTSESQLSEVQMNLILRQRFPQKVIEEKNEYKKPQFIIISNLIVYDNWDLKNLYQLLFYLRMNVLLLSSEFYLITLLL